MAKRYIEEEAVHFCELYFESKAETVHNRLRRNEVPTRFLDPSLMEVYSEFQMLVRRHYPDFNDAPQEGKQKELFTGWFERRVKDYIEIKSKFKDLIKGPSYEVEFYKGLLAVGEEVSAVGEGEEEGEEGGSRGRGDGGGRGSEGVMGRGDGSNAMEIENGGIMDEEDITIIVKRLQQKVSQGDFHKRPINGVKLGTVHFVGGCIVEAHYKKTLLVIVRCLWDKDTINTSEKRREAFLDICAIDYRVYYNYDCPDKEGDIYVKAHIQNNWKQLLSKEKSRADERVKIAISLGYTHATRLMVKPHYFNMGVWDSITRHWGPDKYKKAKKSCQVGL
ncbi:hypothetical protein AgCh_031955 [Apium graveolens]